MTQVCVYGRGTHDTTDNNEEEEGRKKRSAELARRVSMRELITHQRDAFILAWFCSEIVRRLLSLQWAHLFDYGTTVNVP